MRISATIITLNEERNLPRALESLSCVDEIVVVDLCPKLAHDCAVDADAAFDDQLLGGATRAVTGAREELLQRTGELAGWIRDGKVQLRMEFEFPLKDVGEAHRALEGRKTTGKVLLIP